MGRGDEGGGRDGGHRTNLLSFPQENAAPSFRQTGWRAQASARPASSPERRPGVAGGALAARRAAPRAYLPHV